MRKFFSLFALLLVLGWTTPALASDTVVIPGVGDLTDEQQAKIALQVAQFAKTKVEPITTMIPEADQVEPYLKLIDHMGQGVVTLAEKLGVTANDLLTTPVGMVAVGYLAYTLMGNSLAGVLTGMLFIIIAFPVWLFFFYKTVIPITGHKKIMVQRRKGDPVEIDQPVRRTVTFSGPQCLPEVWSLIMLIYIGLAWVIFIA